MPKNHLDAVLVLSIDNTTQSTKKKKKKKKKEKNF